MFQFQIIIFTVRPVSTVSVTCHSPRWYDTLPSSCATEHGLTSETGPTTNIIQLWIWHIFYPIFHKCNSVECNSRRWPSTQKYTYQLVQLVSFNWFFTQQIPISYNHVSPRTYAIINDFFVCLLRRQIKNNSARKKHVFSCEISFHMEDKPPSLDILIDICSKL